MTPEERAARALKRSQPSQEAMAAIYPESRPQDYARSIAQGATFGFGDEIEAAITAMIPGGEGYDDRVKRVRSELKSWQEANPGTALTTELAGAIIPAILTFGSGAAVSGGGALARGARLAKVGAAEGGLAGVGYSNAESLREATGGLIGGAATGMIVSPILGVAGSGVVDIAKNMFGNGASSIVNAELRRLAESTGKSVDEIVEDVAAGRIMAENQTLKAAVKVYTQRSGAEGARAVEKAKDRQRSTSVQAQRTIRKGLTPDNLKLDDNLRAAFKRSDEELRLLEKRDYAEAFPKGTIVPDELSLLVTDAANRVPKVISDLNKISRAEGLPPLFKKNRETGFYEATRPLDMMDVETARRVLRDQSDSLFRSGEGTVGTSVASIRDELQDAFYRTYDGSDGGRSVESVVNAAAVRRQRSDAFEEGRKALGKGLEDVEVMVEDLSPETVAAFRAGFMSAIRNKLRAQEAPMAQFASENRLGAKLRVVFPEADLPTLQRDLETARGAEELVQYLKGQSSTQPMTDAASQIGTGTVNVAANLATGNMLGAAQAGVQALQRMVASATPELTQEQHAQILRVLMNESPSMVRDALTDKTLAERITPIIRQTSARLGHGIRQQGAVQVGGNVGGILGEEYR